VGYRVNINDPYKGAELIRAWSDPPARRHSIQIEINRSLYMDEETVVRHQGFGRLARDLGGLLEQVAAFIRAQIPPPARDSR
jgi:N-formylglutamate deformylase